VTDKEAADRKQQAKEYAEGPYTLEPLSSYYDENQYPICTTCCHLPPTGNAIVVLLEEGEYVGDAACPRCLEIIREERFKLTGRV
jgi:hypothetical protein